MPRCPHCHGNVFRNLDNDLTCLACSRQLADTAAGLVPLAHRPTVDDERDRHRERTVGPKGARS